ncbi:MAG TPA: protein-disulfide reductase DsbD domain-containing protein [Microvirga sp.]|jgi:DsbC/DsbD-like thiol-disulfide interchange protein
MAIVSRRVARAAATEPCSVPALGWPPLALVLRRVALAFVMACLAPLAAHAAPASPWAQGFHSRVRLVSGGMEGGRHLVGVEIELDRGYKTYWRSPGEAGLPPRFVWDGSANAGALDLHWPAPARTEDAGGVAFSYADRVIFPVRITPLRAGEPVRLHLAVDYGVCKDICIPANAELSLDLTGDETHRPRIEAALAAVPRPQPVGAPGPLAVLGIERQADGVSYRVRVRAPEGATLFAEGPENWYLSTSPKPEDGAFTLTVDEKPKDAAGPIRVRLTLAAGGGGIETELALP